MSKAIVIVSFGTSNLDGLKEIEDFEEEIRKSFNDKYYVCKAFTSSIVSNILFNKYGKIVPRLEEVLFNLSNDKYREVYIQPLHIIEGIEFLSIEKTIKEYNYSFSKITLGEVIMGNEEKSLHEGCKLIVDAMDEDLKKTQNIVLVGHGSKSIDNESYNELKNTFIKKGFKSVYMGTLEGEIKKTDILRELIKNNIEEVSMASILMLPGNHIKRDIFGDKNSWRTLMEENNIKVNPVKKSLLEYKELREFYISKIHEKIK